jgi:hypothetical protein
MGEPAYRDLEARYGDSGGFADPRSAFAAFIAEAVSDPERRRRDPHLNAQVQLIMPRLFPYRLFKLESVGEAVGAFARHLAGQGYAGPVALDVRNATPSHSWRDFYGAEIARAVADIYAADFAAFGYDAQDWRGGADRIVESAETLRWRAEIVRRNAMIALLHEKHLKRP